MLDEAEWAQVHPLLTDTIGKIQPRGLASVATSLPQSSDGAPPLPQEVATDTNAPRRSVRKASWSHASNSPVPCEGRSPNSMADEGQLHFVFGSPKLPLGAGVAMGGIVPLSSLVCST